jgi:hypothetical protein
MITSSEHLEAYLSGDKITCFECGRSFKMLGVHVWRTHKMSADEYRIKYNIPITRALSCKDDLDRRSAQTKKRHEAGELNISTAVGIYKKMKSEGLIKHRAKTDYQLREQGQRSRETKPNQIYQDKDFSEFLIRLQTRSLEDVCLDADMPCEEIIRKRVNSDDLFRKHYQHITSNRRGQKLQNLNYVDSRGMKR